MGYFILLILISPVVVIILGIAHRKNEQEKINAMSPSDRINYLYGPINEHLICPHCQTKGLVHAKEVQRTTTFTGTAGGILKAKTKSATTRVVGQHHCEQCASTWDI